MCLFCPFLSFTLFWTKDSETITISSPSFSLCLASPVCLSRSYLYVKWETLSHYSIMQTISTSTLRHSQSGSVTSLLQVCTDYVYRNELEWRNYSKLGEKYLQLCFWSKENRLRDCTCRCLAAPAIINSLAVASINKLLPIFNLLESFALTESDWVTGGCKCDEITGVPIVR